MLMFLAAIPDADPLPLPAPPWLLWGLLLLTFFLHVIAMNFVLGGSLIAAVGRLRRGGHDEAHALQLRQWFGKTMPTVVAAAITFGVAPLLFLQALYGRLFFTSAVLMGWFWFAVVPVLILAYYGTYLLAFAEPRLGRGAVVIAVAVPLIFLAVAFIYSNNMTLMLRPDRFLPLFLQDGRGLHLNLSDPTLIPRYLHMIFGGIAVAGFTVAAYGAFRSRTDWTFGAWAMRHGALWFVAATGLNVLTGIWWLGTLPSEVLRRFMGGDALATLWLSLGIVAGFAALALMLGVIRAEHPRRLVVHSAWALLVTLVTMVLARDQVRGGMLEIAGFQGTTWIEPQWGLIAIFGALLIAAFVITTWMIVLVTKPRGVSEA
jgi:hypothetical protein